MPGRNDIFGPDDFVVTAPEDQETDTTPAAPDNETAAAPHANDPYNDD